MRGRKQHPDRDLRLRRALELAAAGCTVRDAARLQRIRPGAAKRRLRDAQTWLGADNTAHAVALAIRRGVID